MRTRVPSTSPGEDALYFTTSRRRRPGRDPVASGASRSTATAFRSARRIAARRRNAANGMALDDQGRLVVCEQGTDASTRQSTATPARRHRASTLGRAAAQLAQRRRRQERRHDLVHRPELRPPAGLPARAAARATRLPPRPGTGRRRVVADSLRQAERARFSPDERIAVRHRQRRQPGARHLLPRSPAPPRRLRRRRRPAGSPATGVRRLAPGFPDGIKVDAEGRVYASTASGVQVFAPHGDQLGEIELPGAVNFCFGGPERTSCSSPPTTAVCAPPPCNPKGA